MVGEMTKKACKVNQLTNSQRSARKRHSWCWVVSLLLVVAAPSAASADAFSKVTLGVGLHAAFSDSRTMDQGAETAPGVQARLRFMQYLTLQVDYDFTRRDFVPSEEALSPADLVAFPNLRLAAAIHLLPNRYLSPYLALGAGINTEAGAGEASFLAGFGLETTFFSRWVIGLSGQVYYPPPGRIEAFLRRIVLEADYGVADFLKPAAYQLQAELTVYL